MEVLHKPHGTARDRTVLHKGLVSAKTRMTPGPALPPASWRSCNLLLPLLSFQISPTATTWATTSLPCHIPRAGAAPGLGVQALHSQDGTGGFISSIFSLQTLFPNLRHRHAGNHHLLLTHRSPSRLQPSSLCSHAMAG